MRRRSLLAGAGAAILASPSIGGAAAASTLRLVPQAALSSLDPIWTTASVTQGHGYAVFDTLYSLDKGLKPRPQMAEGHEVSPDGLVWTVKLRSGLKFHDGEPVRANDCVASLLRWTKRDAVGQNLAKLAEAWEVVDDRTFRIRLRRPFAPLLSALAKPASVVPFIMPERLAKIDANTQITEMIGSGPFRFLKDEFVSGSRVAYARFDGYVPRDEPSDFMSGGKRVFFDRVEWQVIPDPSTAAAALTKGEVDWLEFALPDLLPLYKGNKSVNVTELDKLGFMGILRFNTLNPPFDKPAVRHAVMAAVDQSDYMRAVNGDNIRWERCGAMFPCGLPFVNEAASGVINQPRNLQRMGEAIKAAGYAGERIVVLNPTDFPSIAPFGEVTADLLKRLGMNVDLQSMDWGTVGQRRTSKSPIDAGGWSIFHTWTSNVSVTNPALNYYLRGQGETGWFGWYRNDETERLTDAWTQAATDAEQQKLFDAVQQEAVATAPFVPLGQYYPVTAFRSDIVDRVPATNALFWNIRRT
jgi:peptide/nickel transport system substrate-binding protein